MSEKGPANEKGRVKYCTANVVIVKNPFRDVHVMEPLTHVGKEVENLLETPTVT